MNTIFCCLEMLTLALPRERPVDRKQEHERNHHPGTREAAAAAAENEGVYPSLVVRAAGCNAGRPARRKAAARYARPVPSALAPQF